MSSKLHTDKNKLIFLTFPTQIIKFHFITFNLILEVISNNLTIKRKKFSENTRFIPYLYLPYFKEIYLMKLWGIFDDSCVIFFINGQGCKLISTFKVSSTQNCNLRLNRDKNFSFLSKMINENVLFFKMTRIFKKITKNKLELG